MLLRKATEMALPLRLRRRYKREIISRPPERRGVSMSLPLLPLSLLLLLALMLLVLHGAHGSDDKHHHHHQEEAEGESSSRETSLRLGPLAAAAAVVAPTALSPQQLSADLTNLPQEGRYRKSKNNRYLLEVTTELVEQNEEEQEEEEIVVDDWLPINEPPNLSHPMPDEWVQRCSNVEADFHHGSMCGAPLSAPCFDRSCIRNGTTISAGGVGTPLAKIYVYDKECTLKDSAQLPITLHSTDRQHQSSYWREAVWRAGMLAETYDEACLFIHVNTHNHDMPCAPNAARWNGGINHVMMEFTPWWGGRSTNSSMSNTFAMDWAFDSLSCYYRSGFDLSLPLVPKKLFPKLQSTPSTSREYFMTFKGTIYLSGYGIEERQAVTRVHDPANGIVSVVACSTMHGEERMPENADYCDRSWRRYNRFDYEQLMNTTFALVPGGRSPGSFRLGEIMSAGAIPVFVVRDWIKPFQEQIDWSSFSFSVTPENVGPQLVETLRAIPPEELMVMQRKSLEAFWKIFGGVSDYSVIAANSIDELVRRLKFHR